MFGGWREFLPAAAIVKGASHLRALSLKGGEHPSANAFLETAGVSNVTSVKRALVALEKAGLIYLSLGEWKFISPFFREWIRRR